MQGLTLHSFVIYRIKRRITGSCNKTLHQQSLMWLSLRYSSRQTDLAFSRLTSKYCLTSYLSTLPQLSFFMQLSFTWLRHRSDQHLFP